MSEGVIGKSVIKKIGSRTVVCSELTVAQVRQLLMAESGDLVDQLLLEHIRLGDLALITGLTGEEIGQMLPSDIDVLAEGCKEANPSFFRLLAKVESLQPTA